MALADYKILGLNIIGDMYDLVDDGCVFERTYNFIVDGYVFEPVLLDLGGREHLKRFKANLSIVGERMAIEFWLPRCGWHTIACSMEDDNYCRSTTYILGRHLSRNAMVFQKGLYDFDLFKNLCISVFKTQSHIFYNSLQS